MDMIRDWLNGSQNFVVGRIIYNKIGADDGLKSLLANGYSDETHKRLVAAFNAFLTPSQSPPTVSDDVIKALDSEWKPLYQKMNMLRHGLHQYGNGNDPDAIAARQQSVFEILQLEQHCNRIWERKDYYLAHGHLPHEPESEELKLPTDPVSLARLLANVKRNIRRNRDENDAEAMQRYLHYKQLYKRITGEDYKEVTNG